MLADLEKKIVDVVERVVPSVVSVTTTKLARDQFSRPVPVQGQGSGVILTEKGFIVTNAHVVDGARDVEVGLSDGRSYKAVVVGESKLRDLAVLKIDADNLSPIQLGESGSLKVGQFAIAVGNPLGLGSTVTFGLVSAVDRTIQGQTQLLEGLIQTSAEINPGNSGGALVNTEGKLVGVPTAMIPFSQGIGFAIAVDGIKAVFKELVETGTISTPWMGIMGVTLDETIAKHYQLSVAKGALLIQVPRGPSSSAGLKVGDVIVAIDEEAISGMDDLRRRVLEKRVGESLRVRFARGKEIYEVYVKLTSAK
ncbi:MAG: PDZ domain-containing protein [Candidatus Thorarchaeota archaeon]|nr:PDZ domain-containing protein [Candidatus Thorarchaeota archaeon]